MYRYGIKNTYRPTLLSPTAYGWQKGATYAPADVPVQWAEGFGLSSDVLRQQFAYEWFQSGDPRAGFANGEGGLTNPPFLSGAAGRLHPSLTTTGGVPARILRGYIRRAEYDVSDPISKTRLYFMYNPEIISRDYVSYLEQSALDPFNTVYQSGNLIAPPSILNFSFELFFDRQEEAMNADHPGVFVDYQFFDMVVRNVLPQAQGATANALPDNGVMMVNPRDITVIFSPQLTVQGRPTNASVTFEKFTHRMTPTRMRIRLQILASYFGPVRDLVEYKKEELPSEDAVPIDQITRTVWDITKDEVDTDGEILTGISSEIISDTVKSEAQLSQSRDANYQIRLSALQWAVDHVHQGGPGLKDVMDPGWTNYTGALAGTNRYNWKTAPYGFDCSGLVTEAYIQIGQGYTMGWNGHPSSQEILQMASLNKTTSSLVLLDQINWESDLLPGDLLIRKSQSGHIGFFMRYYNVRGASTGIVVFDAAGSTAQPVEVGERTHSGHGTFTHLLRPTPLGHVGSAAQAATYNRSVA